MSHLIHSRRICALFSQQARRTVYLNPGTSRQSSKDVRLNAFLIAFVVVSCRVLRPGKAKCVFFPLMLDSGRPSSPSLPRVSPSVCGDGKMRQMVFAGREAEEIKRPATSEQRGPNEPARVHV